MIRLQLLDPCVCVCKCVCMWYHTVCVCAGEGEGYLFFLQIFATGYKMFLAVVLRQPLHTRISLDSQDSRQHFDENLIKFAMYNAEFRTLKYVNLHPGC